MDTLLWKRPISLAFVAMLAVHLKTQAAEQITIDGSTGVAPLVEALAKSFEPRGNGIAIVIGKGLGTKDRIRALADGKIDIAMASHGLDVADIQRQGMQVHPIAKVAVVFAANSAVDVAALSEAQICDLYSGRIRNWAEFGGPSLEVVPLTRPDSEVDAQVVRERISCLANLKMPDSVKVMPKAGEIAQALASTRGAVGMTTMTVVEQSQRQVRPITLNGVVATADNVQRGTYPLTRDSFLVVKHPASPAASRFLAFVLGPDGAAVISANGAVPIKR